MGAYFRDVVLNNTYSRILEATENLCGDIGGSGLRHIHDALLRYTGLVRVTSPQTPGDYLTGICKCAKHIGGDTSVERISLSRVAELLENPKSSGDDSHPDYDITQYTVSIVEWEEPYFSDMVAVVNGPVEAYEYEYEAYDQLGGYIGGSTAEGPRWNVRPALNAYIAKGNVVSTVQVYAYILFNVYNPDTDEEEIIRLGPVKSDVFEYGTQD